MRSPRLSLRLLLPIGLILLVVLLGALQYRWLGQVSEAERAQLQRSLAQRATEFGAEFDREIAVAYEVLSIDSSALAGDVWSIVAERYDTWRGRALYPELVRALYLARSTDSGHLLTKWTPDTRKDETLEWPERFAAVQRAIALSAPRSATQVAVPSAPAGPTPLRAGAIYTMALTPVVDSVPALIVPIATRPQVSSVGPDVTLAFRTAGTDFVIVELSRQVLTEGLIPELVNRYFPGDDGDQYRVAILDRAGERLYARGFPESADDAEVHVDATAAFFTGHRFEFSARLELTESRLLAWQTDTGARTRTSVVSAETTRQTAPRDPVAGTMSILVREGTPFQAIQAARLAPPGWQILLQHGTGSLDEAVAQARLRNLATSFGILAILIVGVGLIVITARKSENLAAQQMEFVATVSHELRTPLSVIRSAAQNLSAGVVDDPAQARQYGALIEHEGRRLTDMVEEVLEFAGMSGNRRPLVLRPVDLTQLAHEVLAAQTPALSSLGITTDVTADADLPLVMADEDALRRALNNLVGNAAKYAADGKWLAVRLTQVRAGQHDEIRVDVSDRGQGIAAEDLPHLFEPFYRGRESVARQIHGNGLGLSLVARIAEAHGGRVTVVSPPGIGTTFSLHLPTGTPLPDADLT